MKCRRRFALFLGSAVTLYGCATAFREERSWSFVTAVGGLQIATPVRLDRRWQLPVRADVSGLHAITNAPTTMNSGLVCDSTDAHVSGRDIFIVIVTTLPHGNTGSSCPPADLGVPEPGQYNVFYGSSRADGVRLGTIDIAGRASSRRSARLVVYG